MSYRIATETRATSSPIDPTIFVLSDAADARRVEIWPALGFNCYRWRETVAGRPVELLFATDKLFDNDRPTRSGIPILFPFPNRIREGRYRWNGKDYQLPLNSEGKNAIHGFAAFKPWRVVDEGADGAGAWLTGEFHGAVDAREARDLWPADYRLRVTYRLRDAGLHIEARVSNPDSVELPFGLGYHPYFRVDEPTCLVQSPARKVWELRDGLPTGKTLDVDAARDLRGGRAMKSLQLDDVYTDLAGEGAGPLFRRGAIANDGVRLEVWSSPDYRELVAFTPPHRRAVCLEPYTCATDAIHLREQGIDAGWRVLAPGQEWVGEVEFRIV